MSAERWLPVVGWDGVYEVSDLGRVRSLPRQVGGRLGTTRTIPSTKYLKGTLRGGPYLRVTLRADGLKVTRSVHRLVAEAFLGSGPAGTEVCHGDGDPTNNILSNLRWDTHSSNIKDAVGHGTWSSTSRTHCPRGHALEDPNLCPTDTGQRRCLACSRGRWRTKAYGETLQEASDRYYAVITALNGQPACRKGHPYASDSFYVDGHGNRICRTCRRSRETRRKANLAAHWRD